MATEQEKAFLGELDFTKIILYQLFELLKSMNEGDIEGSTRKAENLHVFMKYCWDAQYKKERQKINSNIDEKVKVLSNPEDLTKIAKLEMTRTKRLTGILNDLIARSGFLPAREYDGVISEYDGKAILQLMKEEWEEMERLEKEKAIKNGKDTLLQTK